MMRQANSHRQAAFVWVVALVALSLGTSSSYAQDPGEGPLDTTFAGRGWAVAPQPLCPGSFQTAASVAIDSAGRILTTGFCGRNTGSYSDPRDMAIWAFLDTGDPDYSFGPGGYVTYDGGRQDGGTGIVVDDLDRILVAGNRQDSSGRNNGVVWRYLSDGSPDSSFGTNGVKQVRTNSIGHAIALDTSHRILASGSAAPRNAFLCRLLDTGEFDPTFGTGGSVPVLGTTCGPTATADSIITDRLGRIVVAGQSGPNPGSSARCAAVWRFLDTGILDDTFGTGGYVVHRGDGGFGEFHAIDAVVDDFGRVLVVGSGPSSGHQMTIWRFTDGGILDTSFNGQGWRTYSGLAGGYWSTAQGVVLTDDGRPFIGGGVTATGRSNDMVVLSILDDGSLDPSFSPPDGFFAHDGAIGYPGSSDVAVDITLDHQGRLVLCGSSGGSAVVWRLGGKRRTPVIVIPGIMGSRLRETEEGLESVWPLACVDPLRLFRLALDGDGNSVYAIEPDGILEDVPNFYGKLISRLDEEAGYTRDLDLFAFAYDWRLDLAASVDRLKDQIERAKAKAGATEVDIVAHSAGGLLARWYMSLDPEHGIRKVVYIGTPQLGSTRAFTALAFDDDLVARFNPLALPSLRPLCLGCPLRDLIAQITPQFPSVYQLLPQAPFLKLRPSRRPMDVEPLDLGETYREDDNPWMHTHHMNAWENLVDRLALPSPGVEEFAIVGTGIATVDELEAWPDPRPGFLDPSDSYCWLPVPGNGDETVPCASASEQGEVIIYVDRVEHGDLPNNEVVGRLVTMILGGEPLVDEEGSYLIRGTPDCKDLFSPGRTWSHSTCSPVHTEITDEFGNRNGMSGNGEIERGIQLSSFFPLGHGEGGFLPADGHYLMRLSAFEAGSFDLHLGLGDGEGHLSSRSDYEGIPVADHSVATLQLEPTGIAPDLGLDVEGDGVTDFILHTDASPGIEMFAAVLDEIVSGMSLEKGIHRSLHAKLKAARAQAGKGNLHAASRQLTAAMNEVRAQTGKKLTEAQAEMLLSLLQKGLEVGQ